MFSKYSKNKNYAVKIKTFINPKDRVSLVEIKGKSIAVVGASNNPEKYGNKVLQAMKKVSNKIFPVNPKENEISGIKAFKDINEIKEKIDIVVFVVPPEVTLNILSKVKSKFIHFWFQPGSFNDGVINYCKINKLNYTDDKCIIIESEKS